MRKTVLLTMVAAVLASAGTKSYSFTLEEPAVLGSTALAPGDYKVEVVDQKALFRNGRFHGEAPVKVESAESKYNQTTVRLNKEDGKYHLQEIHVGGTKTKLVFSE